MPKDHELPGKLKAAVDNNRHKRNLNLMSMILLIYTFSGAELTPDMHFLGGGLEVKTVLPIKIIFILIFTVSWWRYWASVPAFSKQLKSEVTEELVSYRAFASLVNGLVRKRLGDRFSEINGTPSASWSSGHLKVRVPVVVNDRGSRRGGDETVEVQRMQALGFYAAAWFMAIWHRQVFFEVLLPHVLATLAATVLAVSWLIDVVS